MAGFNQYLNIIPRVSPGQLQKTERKISGSFKKTSRNFAKSLQLATAVLALTAGRALANAINEPLDKAKTQLKDLLEQSKSTAQLSLEANTSEGLIRNIESVGVSKGLERGEATSMFQSFVNAVNDARDEIAEGGELSDRSKLLENFAKMDDLGEGFINFLSTLRKSDKNVRSVLEREVLGSRQRGFKSQFIDTDIRREERSIGQRSQLERANKNLLRQRIEVEKSRDEQERKNILAVGSERSTPLTQAIIREQEREGEKFRGTVSDTDLLKNLIEVGNTTNKTLDAIQETTTKAVGLIGRGSQYVTDKWLEWTAPKIVTRRKVD